MRPNTAHVLNLEMIERDLLGCYGQKGRDYIVHAVDSYEEMREALEALLKDPSGDKPLAVRARAKARAALALEERTQGEGADDA